MANANGLYAQAQAARSMEGQLGSIRGAYTDILKATDGMEVRTLKAATATDTYTRRLKEQKVTFSEAIKQRKLFSKVVQEQIALQKAEAVAWRQLPDGRMTGDLVMNKQVTDSIMKRRMQVSMLNEALKSGADNMVKWGKNTQWAGRQLTVGFTVPMGMAAAATGKLAYEMDKSLTQITKVYGDANTEFQDTTEQIRSAAMQTASNMASMYGQSAKDTLEIQAQFAAAGKTGAELQEATAAATRARMLNEMDLQTAISASITMQTVYGYTAEELGQKWDYINAVANQTVLGAEDFAVAIPKVAGVIKELGGDLEDVGTLMTAFRAAGIEAAEGANALKTISFRAVSAYGKGLDTFSKMTGQDLNDIIKQTNGETIPTLLAMYKAMENLSTPQKIAVVKDVFGIYQGNKALILLEQLAEKSEQVAQAMAVGDNSVAENAKIANQELARMNEQPFKKIQKAVESIKIEMANLGKTVLPIVSSFLDGVQNLLGWLNGLDGSTKAIALILAGIVGIAGPVTMLLGLFANLFGNVLKMAGAMGNLVATYRVTDAQERARILMERKSVTSWNNQTAAVSLLVKELEKMNIEMAESNALAQANARKGAPKALFMPPTPTSIGAEDGGYISQRDSAGRMQHFLVDAEGKKKRISAERLRILKQEHMVLGQIQLEEQRRINAMHEQALVMNDQYDKMHKNLDAKMSNIGMGLGAAGMLGSMFGPESVQGVANTAAVMGTVLALAPGVGSALVRNLVAPIKLFGPTATASMKQAATSAMAFIRGAALPLGAALLGVVYYWDKVSDASKKALENAEAYQNSAKALGELAGVNWNDATGMPEQTKTGQQATVQMAQKFREQFEKEARALVNTGAETGDRWGVAIAKGVEVRLHGGTVDAAKQATRTALQIMGQTFSDEEFETQVNVRVNFENPDTMINEILKTARREGQRAINDEGTGWEKRHRDFLGFFEKGRNDLTAAAKSNAINAGSEVYNAILGIPDPAKRKEAYDRFVKENTGEMRQAYETLVAKRNAAVMKDGKVQSFNDFLMGLGGTTLRGRNSMAGALGITNDEVDDMLRNGEMIRYMTQGIAEAQGELSDSDIAKTFDPAVLERYLGPLFQVGKATDELKPGVDIISENKQMHEEYGNMMDKAAQQGKNLSEAERLKMLNIVRANHGIAAATSLTQGFNLAQVEAENATMGLSEALQKLQIGLTEEQATSAYRGVMEKTSGDLVSAATDSLKREADLSMEALDNQMDAAQDKFDDRADALDKNYDNREKAMQKRQDAANKRLDANQDARRKREEAYYDNRIKGIEAVIEKEEKAEEIRQKIFEAEKTRLQRMSEMYNRSIDFNMALNSGNLDEAAKIGNDMESQVSQWSLDDSAAAAGDASKVRTDALNKQKDNLAAQKSARMEVLDAIEEREKEVLKAQQDRERESLESARQAARDRLDVEREASRKYYEDQKRTNQAVWEDRQRKLALELETIRAYIPRNKAELDKQARDIDAAYRKYGGNLQAYGTKWSTYIGDALSHNVGVSANELRTQINWQNIGQEISNSLIKGGFGMTAAEFGKWLNGGQAPAGSFMSAQYKSTRTGPSSDLKSSGGGRDTRGGVFHVGGIAGETSGGYGKFGPGHRDEVAATLLKGEGILTREATDYLGKDNIMALNAGKLPDQTGPWSGGFSSVMGAMAAGATKNLMNNVLQGLAQRKMEQLSGAGFSASPGKVGKYGGINLSQEQLNNAATIMSVGKSMGASQRDLIIGLMTAMQESTLRNISYGDRDSLGLFQQRPSQGWGTAAQIMNPRYSAQKFFEGLLKIKDRGSLRLTEAAQKVQRSAYPEAYARWETMARAIAGATGLISTGSYSGIASGINLGNYGGGAGGWMRPASGPVTSEFGMRRNPVTGVYKLHDGIDIGAPTGASIWASRPGVVAQTRYSSGVGNYTLLDHGNGVRTGYAHQSKILVSPGQMVGAGQVIGRVGNTGNSTGPHLHFSYFNNGQAFNPRSIIPQFSEGGYTLSSGLAGLHPDELVLSKPLTQQLHVGLEKFANGDGADYNVTIDLRGSTGITQKNINDIEKAVYTAIDKREGKLGRNRKVGGN